MKSKAKVTRAKAKVTKAARLARGIEAFNSIRAHAQSMAGRTPLIYDKTDPIIRTCEAMLADLDAPVERPLVPPARDALDIGQGEGCEGGKCAVPPRHR